jgi:hypothetical protein
VLARKKEREAQSKETVWETQLREQRERKKARKQGTQAGAKPAADEGKPAKGNKGDKGGKGEKGEKAAAEKESGFEDDFFKGEGPADWDAEADSDSEEENAGRRRAPKAATVVVPTGKAAKDAARLAKVSAGGTAMKKVAMVLRLR